MYDKIIARYSILSNCWFVLITNYLFDALASNDDILTRLYSQITALRNSIERLSIIISILAPENIFQTLSSRSL